MMRDDLHNDLRLAASQSPEAPTDQVGATLRDLFESVGIPWTQETLEAAWMTTMAYARLESDGISPIDTVRILLGTIGTAWSMMDGGTAA